MVVMTYISFCSRSIFNLLLSRQKKGKFISPKNSCSFPASGESLFSNCYLFIVFETFFCSSHHVPSFCGKLKSFLFNSFWNSLISEKVERPQLLSSSFNFHRLSRTSFEGLTLADRWSDKSTYNCSFWTVVNTTSPKSVVFPNAVKKLFLCLFEFPVTSVLDLIQLTSSSIASRIFLVIGSKISDAS